MAPKRVSSKNRQIAIDTKPPAPPSVTRSTQSWMGFTRRTALLTLLLIPLLAFVWNSQHNVGQQRAARSPAKRASSGFGQDNSDPLSFDDNARRAQAGKTVNVIKNTNPDTGDDLLNFANKNNVVSGLSVKLGAQLVSETIGPCKALPVDVLQTYYVIETFEKALELITMQIPFFKNQPSTVNLTAEGTTGSLGIGLGFCFAMNQNTYAFSIFPALPLAGIEIGPLRFGFKGIAISLNNTLQPVYQGGLVWDGFTYSQWYVDSQFWLAFNIFQTIPPTIGGKIGGQRPCPAGPLPINCAQQPRVQIGGTLMMFGGFESLDQNLAVQLSDVELSLLVFPTVRLGSGFGGFRNSLDPATNVCSPSGIFVNFQTGFQSPVLDLLVQKFLKLGTSRSVARVDFATTWDGSTGKQLAMVMKYVNGVEVLGYNLGSLEIRAEYLSQYEVTRRRNVYTQSSYGCCLNYDSNGICQDNGGLFSGDKWLLDNASPNTDYLLTSFGYVNNVNFGIVVVRNMGIIIVAPLASGQSYLINMYAEVSVLMIVDISAYLTLTDTYVDWQVSVAVLELGSVTIHGTVNHAGGYSASQQTVPSPPTCPPVTATQTYCPTVVASGVTSTATACATYTLPTCDVVGLAEPTGITGLIPTPGPGVIQQSSVAAGSWTLTVFTAIATEAKAIAAAVVAVVNQIATKITNIANQVKNIVEQAFNYVVNVINDIGNFAKKVVNDIAAALGQSWEYLKSAGVALLRGDVVGFLKDIGYAIGLLRNVDQHIIHEGTFTNYGCEYLHLQWQECFNLFGFNVGCSTKTSDSYVDQDCVKSKATSAGMITQYMYEQNYVVHVVNIGNGTNQGLYYARNTDASQVFPAPVINGGAGAATFVTDGENDTVQTASVNIQAQRLAAQNVGTETAPPSTIGLNIDMSSNASFYASVAQNRDMLHAAMKPVLMGNNAGVTADMQNQTSAFVPIIIAAPPPVILYCDSSYTDQLANLGQATITQQDPRCNATIAIMPPSSSSAGTTCATSQGTWNYLARTDCGQTSNVAYQNVTTISRPPVFTVKPPDVTINCENSIDPRYTGIANATASCAQQSVRVDFQDSPAMSLSCGVKMITRSWYAYPGGCSTGQTNSSYTQRITIKDNIAPYWSKFPPNYVAGFSKPYGTDLAGVPTAYDSCASDPVTIAYTDATSNATDFSCSAEKTLLRTWTATDACGNQATREQVIKFTNPTRLLGDATLYQVFAYGGANLQSTQFAGQLVAGQNLIASTCSYGWGNCSFTSYSAVAQSYLSNFNKNITRGSDIGYYSKIDYAGANAAAIQLGNRLSNLTFISTLNGGPRSISCVATTVSYKPELIYPIGNGTVLTGVPNYGDSICSTASIKTFSQQTLGSVSGTVLSLTGSDPVYNVFGLAGSVLYNTALTLNIICPKGSTAIINVSGTSLKLRVFQMNLSGGVTASDILWNFYQATAITPVSGGSVWPGTILAPMAYWSGNAFSITGQLIVNGLSVNSQSFQCAHYQGFRTCADLPLR